MKLGGRNIVRGLLVLTAAGLSGCLVAAAGAGAGGAIVFSGHTAEAIVERSVEEMAGVAERVLAEEPVDVSDTRSEKAGARRAYVGKKGNLTVTVVVERADGGTKVQVTAQRNATNWDDDYAKALLAKIIG